MSVAWPKVPLGRAQVALIDCDHRTPPAAESGYPYLAIPQIAGGRIDLKAARRISERDFVDWTRKAKPRAEDVVLSRRCNPGETAVVPEGAEFALGQNLVLLRSEGRDVAPSFLRWLVRGPEWWSEVRRFLNTGAVFDSLKCADVPKFRLTLPPLPEQKAIAQVLGSLDDKIELNRRMGETLEAMARALFQAWFVDFEPVRAKAEGRETGLPEEVAALFPDRLEESELGEIPAGWECRPLGRVAGAIFSGGTPRTDEPAYWGGSLPWLSSGETRATAIVAAEKSITEIGARESSTRLAPSGASVIASAGQGHTRGQTSVLLIDTYINQSTVAVVPSGGPLSRAFLFLDLKRRYEEFRRISDGHSSRGSLTTKLLSGITVCVPSLGVREAFDRVAEPMIDQIGVAVKQSATLATLRDTLLPKLLSGELRVAEAARVVEAVL